MEKFILSQLQEAQQVLANFLENPKNIASIQQAAQILTEALVNNNKAISCGNGGSMSDAMHFAEELSGRYRENRKALAALAISDSGHLSCVANDFGYDFVFSRFVEALGNENDVLFAISTSGNSKNVINAAKVAKEKGLKVIGLTGKNGGDLTSLCDVEIRVEHNGYADRIQEIHIKVIHILIGLVEQNLKLA
ncbi:MAG: D-sedoheptulose 7-phosphate isomerase [Luteibaculaceae bacterium]